MMRLRYTTLRYTYRTQSWVVAAAAVGDRQAFVAALGGKQGDDLDAGYFRALSPLARSHGWVLAEWIGWLHAICAESSLDADRFARIVNGLANRDGQMRLSRARLLEVPGDYAVMSELESMLTPRESGWTALPHQQLVDRLIVQADTDLRDPRVSRSVEVKIATDDNNELSLPFDLFVDGSPRLGVVSADAWVKEKAVAEMEAAAETLRQAIRTELLQPHGCILLVDVTRLAAQQQQGLLADFPHGITLVDMGKGDATAALRRLLVER